MSNTVKRNVKTWDVRRWDNKPAKTKTLSLCCPNCSTDAELEVGVLVDAQIIAAIGLGLIFDPPGYRPPPNFMPDELKCRACRKIFSSLEDDDVR